MKSIYKTQEDKSILLSLYHKKLSAFKGFTNSLFIDTRFGKTHVLQSGKKDGQPLIVFHGINAGAPLTLEAIIGLGDTYCLYVIDTIGQVGLSDENRLNIKNNSFALWTKDIMYKLNIATASFIGVSYGGYILQNVLMHQSSLVSKAIFVVPSGFANGPIGTSLKKLSLPLIRFLISKKSHYLKQFLSAFYSNISEDDLLFHRHILLGTFMDYRRPPLLKPSQVAHVESPVYCIVASDDVFFPGEKTLKRCALCFKNFSGSFLLNESKHMPKTSSYPSIQSQIDIWLKN
jgi:pimeloyl-ACP methyl ester carboxylesterase